MSDEPFLGPNDEALFTIEDARERADRLQDLLVPKLKMLLQWSRECIAEIYGEEALRDLKNGSSPAHRKSAKKTDFFYRAHVGLHPNIATSYLTLDIQFVPNDFNTYLIANIAAYRPREAEALISVLREHRESALRDCPIRLSSFVE